MKHVTTLLDLEDASIADTERAAEVSRLLEAFVLPFFAEASTLSELRPLPVRVLALPGVACCEGIAIRVSVPTGSQRRYSPAAACSGSKTGLCVPVRIELSLALNGQLPDFPAIHRPVVAGGSVAGTRRSFAYQIPRISGPVLARFGVPAVERIGLLDTQDARWRDVKHEFTAGVLQLFAVF